MSKASESVPISEAAVVSPAKGHDAQDGQFSVEVTEDFGMAR
jgi:hypothetical protein